ncbi:hypothetical protein GCM10009430_32450 [Aquimarina litoralis]|uniref:WD40-like Beta Propeller Repeat n=1 Tax=Aquimarina litoralis TaxID=584605 RepID=A0ABN1J1M1_9FLAO
MKSILTRITFSLLSLFIYKGFSQNQITDIYSINFSDELTFPKWSPNGSKILCTDHHNSKLYIIDLKSEEVTMIKEKEGIGYMANWSADGDKIIYRDKPLNGYFSDSKAKSLSLTDGAVRNEININPQNTKVMNQKNKNLQIYINPETLQLEAKNTDTNVVRKISNEVGQYYHCLVSPSGNKVVVHEGSSIYLYHIYDKKKREYLGEGIATSWLKDDKGIITFEDKSSDGHNITASELYMISLKDKKKVQLTRTKDRIEMNADVSPDGKKIVFSDEKTGKLFVGNLKYRL